MGAVLIPVIITIACMIVLVAVVAYLADQTAEHHDKGKG
jgi:hypothetical protein